MNSLKRIFISLKGQIDHVADEFENHEALAGAAIQDLQAIASKTRLHLHRVSKMSAQYQKQLAEQQEQACLWSERAIKVRAEDEQKALQCVKRLRLAQQQVNLLEQQYQQSTAQEAKVRNDLNTISEQLLVLKNKKEILAARQNRAGIQREHRGDSMQDVQSVFERWEGAVVSTEYEMPDALVDTDNFANEFEREEDELALKIMLDELTEVGHISNTKN
ncbi:MAG: PspA/IM30 family protein [Methylococcaceae bacterium]|nr:PspA/IM30 family protein [Methylococcaceae bacterium]